MSNLVNSVMEEMEMNNSANDLNYQPQMQQGGGGMMQGGGPMMQQGGMMPQSPVQEQQYMNNVGEVNYVPQSQMQAPTMSASPETMDMEAPDLSVYGMEEEETGWTDRLLNEVKAPLIVAVLAFVMTLPQVSGMIRTLFSKVTTNDTLIGLGAAVLMAVLFFIAMKFLA